MSYAQVPELPFLMELDPTHHGDACPYVADRRTCMQCGYPPCESGEDHFEMESEDALQWPVYDEAKGG
jgi:hypothetical protein